MELPVGGVGQTKLSDFRSTFLCHALRAFGNNVSASTSVPGEDLTWTCVYFCLRANFCEI